MKPSQIGALVGAFLGLSTILLYKVLVITSSLMTAVLWPGHIFIAAFNGFGSFGHMILDTVSVFANILIYAAVGYGIGWLIPTRSEQ